MKIDCRDMVRLALALNYSGQPVGWSEHFSNGGTGVGRYHGKYAEALAATVKAFDDPTVYMVGTDLHTSREHPVDLSDFWAAHRRAEKQLNDGPTS